MTDPDAHCNVIPQANVFVGAMAGAPMRQWQNDYANRGSMYYQVKGDTSVSTVRWVGFPHHQAFYTTSSSKKAGMLSWEKPVLAEAAAARSQRGLGFLVLISAHSLRSSLEAAATAHKRAVDCCSTPKLLGPALVRLAALCCNLCG